MIVDDGMLEPLRAATGVDDASALVDAALRYYAAALAEDPGHPSRRLGDEMRDAERTRVSRSTPSARAEAALALGEEQLRLAARTAGVSCAEARRRHEEEKQRTRRKAR